MNTKTKKSVINKKTVKEPKKIKVFEAKKMMRDFQSQVGLQGLSTEDIMAKIKVCRPLAKAFEIGILPDYRSEIEILKFLNKTKKDYTVEK